MSEALEQLNEITGMIAEARDSVSDGEVIDLSEIQDLVQAFCLNIQNIPPEDSETLQTKIVSMIENLNHLAQELKSQQQSLGTDVIRHAVRTTQNSPKDEN